MPSATSMKPHCAGAPETTARNKQTHRRTHLWLPDQHGAWMMMAVPFILGSIGGTWAWQHIILALLWLCGYCCFFAFSGWVVHRRKSCIKKNQTQNPARAPFFVWFTATILAGFATLMCAPQLLPWLAVFAPVAVISLTQTFAHRIRSLLTRSCEVIAAGLMCAVAWHLGVLSAHDSLGWQQPFPLLSFFSHEQVAGAHSTMWDCISAWEATIPISAIYATIAVTAYFWSTVPFVKSLMRERNSLTYRLLVFLTHGIFFAIAFMFAVAGYTSFAMPIFWLIAGTRAWLFTQLSKKVFGKKTRGGDKNLNESRISHHASKKLAHLPLTPKKLLMVVGITETILSVAYIPVVLASVQ